jgi:hypothetical protein
MNRPVEFVGLLGPEHLPSTRRLRTLGLGATVRYFNDRAVPGMGGVWFAKQLVLALFGVHMAERTGRSKVEVANAIEALGCWLAIHERGLTRDRRVRGVRKLANIDKGEMTFKNACRRGFYVSQPMRMATVQPLPALGLVTATSSRFNAFECTDHGKALVAAFADEYRPSNGTLDGAIARWIGGHEITLRGQIGQALDPREPLAQPVRDLLLARLREGRPDEPDEDRRRRRDALAWVDSLRRHRPDAVDSTSRPPQIQPGPHWLDLEAGRRFFLARNAALDLLIALERHVRNEGTAAIEQALLEKVGAKIDQLEAAARGFLGTSHPNAEARRFCAECVVADRAQAVRSLVDRDGIVLVRTGDRIAPGPLFARPPDADLGTTGANASAEDTAEEADGDEGPRSGIPWPPGTSFRLNHLFLLNLDLHGGLDAELKLDRAESAGAP